MKNGIFLRVGACAALVTTAAAAQQATNTYDSRGRLRKVEVKQGSTTTSTTNYNYDVADNRTVVSATVPFVPVGNGSFENPALGGSFQYTPPSSGANPYLFYGLSGIAANGSGFGFAAAPDGAQAGFVQSNAASGGWFTINVSGLTVGRAYRVTFYSVGRPGYGATNVRVSVNGTLLSTIMPTSNWVHYQSASFTAASSAVALEFRSLATPADAASAIDRIRIQ